MNKILKQILILFFMVGVLILPYFVFAGTAKTNTDTPLGKLQNVAVDGGYNKTTDETSFSVILGTVVSVFLSLLGIIFIILIILAGYNWMTAAGNEEKVSKAQDTLWRAVIGLIITVGSYAIWEFVFSKLLY